MTKNRLKLFATAFCCLWAWVGWAQTLSDYEATVSWPLSDGTDDQVAAYAPDGSDAYFKSSSISYGSNLSNVGVKTSGEQTQTAFEPAAKQTSASTENAIEFSFTIRDGLTFTPTNVSFKSTRYGTNGGYLDITWVGSDGSTLTLATGQYPARNNEDTPWSEFSFDADGATASTGTCILRINLYSLDPGKQVGFNDLVITGLLNGTVEGSVTVEGEAVVATWPFTEGTEDQTATFTPDGASNYFKNSYFTYGSELTLYGVASKDDIVQTTFTPTVNNASSASTTNAIDFIIVPKTGLTFTPTKVSLKSTRYGTDGGKLDIAWFSSDGTTVSLATGVTPERNNTEPYYTEYSYDITGATASDGECGIRINLYSLGNSKQVGFCDIVIEGTVEGSILDITQYTLTVSVSPEGAGTVSVSPLGSVFDEGDEVTLSQQRNFGYSFVNWTDSEGNELSSDESFVLTMDGDKQVTANYEAMNTYELTYSVTGGANDYMVELAPEPTVVDGKNLYEEGTNVSLTATGNTILTFTNWSTGETVANITLTMDQDRDVTANYSAIDYIVGWDFVLEGGSGRKADFAAEDNDDVTLVLRNADGDTQGWLDKSRDAADGYEGRYAAVNWRTTGLGEYYWQTQVNATAFKNIKVTSAMLYNYNAYTTQNVQYSLDGDTWETIGSINISGAKNWTDSEFSLPEAANNQPTVYIRWISDTESAIDGTTSDNDGIAISGIYITGDEDYVDDGTAPVLVSTVPEEGSETASANGRVILTFDEKVVVADGTVATLGNQELTPTVSGRTVLFEYKGLEYSTPYTFTLPGGVVADRTGNTMTEAVTINFSTRTRPTVTKALYDFVVPDDGTFSEAIAAANSRSDNSTRYRIFIKQGDYVIPASETETITGSDGVVYPSPITRVTAPNISIIGEDMDNTSIVNTVPDVEVEGTYGTANPLEGLHNNQTIDLGSNATQTYIQDLTIKSGMADNRGRNGALEDASDKTICKDVVLHAYQDTYLSNNQNGRFYFEGGRLRGRTDYLCGKGDVFYNGVELVMCASGGYICAPSTPKQYGYVFRDCSITGEQSGVDGNYTLGRPWGSGTPIALYINTRMDVQPSAAGWSEMSGGWPARFAEYNSTTSSGTVISLTNRKTTFGDGYVNDPELTAAEAAQLTVGTVMGADDDWDPTEATEQASAPSNVVLAAGELTWDTSDYVLCWAVCKDGKVMAFTTEPAYAVDDTEAEWSVRAANEMGGLGEATVATTGEADGISQIGTDTASRTIVGTAYYGLNGIRTEKAANGVCIQVVTYSDGTVTTTKVVK